MHALFFPGNKARKVLDSSFSLVVLLPAHSEMSSLVRAPAHSGLTASSNQGCDKMSVQVSAGHYVRRSQDVMLYNVLPHFSVFYNMHEQKS